MKRINEKIARETNPDGSVSCPIINNKFVLTLSVLWNTITTMPILVLFGPIFYPLRISNENPTDFTPEISMEKIDNYFMRLSQPVFPTPVYMSTVFSYYLFRQLWFPVQLCPKKYVRSMTLFLAVTILFIFMIISWPFLLIANYFFKDFLEIAIRKTWIFGIDTAISINNCFSTEKHPYTLLHDNNDIIEV